MQERVDVKLKADLLPRSQTSAVKAAADKLFNAMLSGGQGPSGCYLANEIWPNLKQANCTEGPTLVLGPMDRVGGDPGKSGNAVIVGQFFLSSDVMPSRPMIIKISPDPEADKELAAKKRGKLITEYRAAAYLAAQFGDRSRFACPLHLFEDLGPDQPAVLWAPFESSCADSPSYPSEQSLSAKTENMARYMSGVAPAIYEDSTEREKKVNKMFDAIDSLKTAHSAKGTTYRETVKLVDHYEDHLRDFFKEDCLWAKPWHRLWGRNAQVWDFGEKKPWPNPILVLEKLRERDPQSLRMGFIHGDLHPRNIVFAYPDRVCVIDFGWARPASQESGDELAELQHIVKDFVLLEANLRFMTLPPFLPYGDVKEFGDWIPMDEKQPSVGDKECNLRMKLVRKLRERAKLHVGTCSDWDIEYIAPLFLVSFGLLKHCHNADCTWAARYTVLSLARHLVNRKEVSP